MDYIELLEENVYQYEVMKRQIETQAFLQECVAIAEGSNVIENIAYINEAANDKQAGFFAKFTAWIAGIWNKFLTRAEKLFKNDIAFLTNNKEIILGKKMQDGTISMASGCDECVKHLQEKATVIFPDVSFMNDLADRANAEGDVSNNIGQWRKDIQVYVTNKKFDPKDDFAAACKAYYCPGEDTEVKTSAINMADLYNFCMNSNSFRDGVKRTKDAFDKWMAKAEITYNAKFKEVSKQNIKNGGAAKSNASENNAGNAENKHGVTEESYVVKSTYSAVFESYITEAKVNFNSSNSSQPNSNGNYVNRNSKYTNDRQNVTDAGSAKNANSATRDQIKVNNDAAKGSNRTDLNNAAAAKANSVAAADKAAIKTFTSNVSNYCKVVTETVGTVLGAMCTGCEKISREYMSIITAHVMSYTGKEDTTNTNAGTQKADSTAVSNAGGRQNVTGGSVTPGIK